MLGFGGTAIGGSETEALLESKDTLSLETMHVRAKRAISGTTNFQGIRNRSSSVLNFQLKRKNRDPNLAIAFVDDNMVPGAQVWMYPDGSGYPRPAMTDVQAKDGRFSLEVILKADAYSGGAVCSPAPVDLSPYLETGVVELWVKGAEGQEVFSVGLLDNGNNPAGRALQLWVNSRSFAKVSKEEWKRVRFPLRALGTRGSYWSEEVNARIFNTFNWKQVSCFTFDIDKERHKSFKIWMDNVTILKKGPEGSLVGGSGYAITNEDFK